MSITLATARSLMAVLAPLTGTRSSGQVLVSADPGPSAIMLPETYGLPVIGGSIRYERAIKAVEPVAVISLHAADLVVNPNPAWSTTPSFGPSQNPDGVYAEIYVEITQTFLVGGTNGAYHYSTDGEVTWTTGTVIAPATSFIVHGVEIALTHGMDQVANQGNSLTFAIVSTTVPAPNPPVWPCTHLTPVNVVSNLGGAEMNLPAGTPIRWFPAAAGIEAQSVVRNLGTTQNPVGMTGGAAPTAFGSIKQLAFFEELGVKDVGSLLARGVISQFPAAVLSWEASGETTPLGRAVWAQPQTFGLYILDTREDSQASRRVEALAILDSCCGLLLGRKKVDGRHFTTPAGVHIKSRRPLVYDSKWYVYRAELGLAVTMGFEEYRTYQSWAKVRLDATTPEATSPLSIVTDNELDMP